MIAARVSSCAGRSTSRSTIPSIRGWTRSAGPATAARTPRRNANGARFTASSPRFYHMDTALAPLPGGEVMYLPSAFTAAGRGVIRERVAPHERIEIAMEDGCRLAANAVALGNTLIMSGCSRRLRAKLGERGYEIVTTPLSSFLRSGGSAFCLTLRLDRRSVPLSGVAPEAAVA